MLTHSRLLKLHLKGRGWLNLTTFILKSLNVDTKWLSDKNYWVSKSQVQPAGAHIYSEERPHVKSYHVDKSLCWVYSRLKLPFWETWEIFFRVIMFINIFFFNIFFFNLHDCLAFETIASLFNYTLSPVFLSKFETGNLSNKKTRKHMAMDKKRIRDNTAKLKKFAPGKHQGTGAYKKRKCE